MSGRPHWLPGSLWLGKAIHEWVVQAFPDQEMAARWAAEDGARRIWQVYIPEDTKTYRGFTIPASHGIREVSP